jgi:hypothetical protein
MMREVMTTAIVLDVLRSARDAWAVYVYRYRFLASGYAELISRRWWARALLTSLPETLRKPYQGARWQGPLGSTQDPLAQAICAI